MQQLWIAVAAIALCWLSERLVRWWQRREQEARIQEAQRVLAKNGMDAFSYMPGVGVEHLELRRALDVMEYTGKIVLDGTGNVVGRLIPKIAKGPHLRLVVDNSK